ncbi:MAG: acetyltransferase [Flavobacteriales bacterium]
MDNLVIVGTGDYAEMASFFLKDHYAIVGYTEERAYRKLPSFNELPIFDFEDLAAKYNPSNLKVFVAVGPNRVNTVRERLYKEVKNLGFECVNYIHPKAFVASPNQVGENSMIFPNAVVEPGSHVGNNCVMWSGAILAHHSVLGDHCFMAPGSKISGRTAVKNNCFIGINATIRDNVIIEESCIIGAGAIIKKNTIKNGVYSAEPTLLYNSNAMDTKV